MRCEVHKKQQAFYWVDSWLEEKQPRALCCMCVDQMITRMPGVKETLNIRLISGEKEKQITI